MGSLLLGQRLGQLRRRLLLIAGAAATIWAVSAALVVLLAWNWLDLLWELSPQLRIAAWWSALALALAILTAALVAARLRSRHDSLARRLDRVTGSGGQVLSGLELGQSVPAGSLITRGLALLAVDRAARLAADEPARRVVPARPLGISLGAFSGLAAILILPGLMLQDLAATQWKRFYHPYGDTPPYSRVKFDVRPGDARVIYGSGLEVAVTTSGAPVDQLELVLATAAASEEPLPMFSDADNTWRAALADLCEPTAYWIRAGGARSRRYRIEIITVPRIEQVQFVVTPPAYTNQSPYEGPLPDDGLSGLAGAQVRVVARSNRPLAGGQLRLNVDGKASQVAMQPLHLGACQVAGSFTIGGSGKFEIVVTDVDGQPSRESFAGKIHLLEDQRPFVRILEPPAMSLATPDIAVPVSVSAEDDFGVSKLELFRSLNDSRPLPMTMPLPTPAARRADRELQLPLAAYGLAPGDVIKLFARVEDNDPAGAKGFESSVVTLQIVSQEQFEQMLRTRYNLEMLMSKYRAAQRRMEALQEQIEGLKKKLEAGDKDAAAELERLEKQLRHEAQALRESAGKPLPYDVDKQFSKHLSRLADSLDKAARRLERSRKSDPSSALQALEETLAEMKASDEELEHEAVEPLEHLELVFPLLADEARFVEIYRLQRDLAERTAALRGSGGDDSPAAKVRMRDLEAEQRRVRESLEELLSDIEQHAARLPDEPQFAELRSMAEEFVAQVRASDALEQMSQAETALAEFAGTRAHQRAKAAADTLERFLGKGQATRAAGRQCLKFQPSLSAGLGDTIGQLLADMGLEGGVGETGQGRGGYSSRSGSTDSVGLYGRASGMENFGGRRGATGVGGRGTGSGDDRDEENPGAISQAAAPAAAGANASQVPPQYRQRVSEYFRRLVEELNSP